MEMIHNTLNSILTLESDIIDQSSLFIKCPLLFQSLSQILKHILYGTLLQWIQGFLTLPLNSVIQF